MGIVANIRAAPPGAPVAVSTRTPRPLAVLVVAARGLLPSTPGGRRKHDRDLAEFFIERTGKGPASESSPPPDRGDLARSATISFLEARVNVAHHPPVLLLRPAGAVNPCTASVATQDVAPAARVCNIPGTPPKTVTTVPSELLGVDPRDAPDCFQPHPALPGLERVVPPAELPGHHVVPVGRGPRPVGRPGAAVKVARANHVHPALRAVDVPAHRALRAVAHRAVHRVPAEEGTSRACCWHGGNIRARSPRDGAGRGLPAGQSTRLPVALVQVLEIEPAHVAPRGGRIVGVMPAGEQDILELVPLQEARRAGRRKRYPETVAAEEPSVPRARAPRRARGRIPSVAGRGRGLAPRRRGVVPIVRGIPLLLSDVGVNGPAPGGA